MKYQKLFGVLSAGFIMTGTVVFANAWKSENIQKEAEVWETEIEKWDTLHEQWYAKRENYYDRYFESFSRTRGEFCDNSGCFKEGLFDISYTSAEKTFEISSLGNFEMKQNGFIFENSNRGQVLELQSLNTKEAWESSNFGQVLRYRDENGNEWENSNYGQSIEFSGMDGSAWESSNFGQSLEFTDKNGQTWESSNFGQSVKNNGSRVDFDMQKDLFNY